MPFAEQQFAYVTNTTFAEAAARIRAVHRIAVVCHTKADGDSLGSMLALARALAPMGKRADLFLMGPLDPNLKMVAEETPLLRVEDSPPGDDYDLIIIFDTGAWSQLEQVADWLRRHHDRAIAIDHHSRGDADVAAMRIVDPSMASTTQLLVPLLDELGCELTGGVGGVAEPLFLGLATDTGWFRYGSANADVFALAARLLRAGVDKSRLYQIIEETHRPERLALEARALASLEYANGGSFAMMSLTQTDFEETGGLSEDLTGIVNLPLIVGSVRVSILFAQTEPGLTKVSFRSKPPALEDGDAASFTDVNKLAQQFGGGGHVHAAGARIRAELDEAKRVVRETISRAVR